MSADSEALVIVGASLAGAIAAETLRSRGYGGRLLLFGEEPQRPYERPPLSKDYLRGEAAEAPFVHPEDFYETNEIELRTSTRVIAIEPRSREVELADGERVDYRSLLLATGAEPRRLPIAGAGLPGVHYLRTIEDSAALGAKLRERPRVAVIGAGWIGSEVAASARTLGCEVTVIERAAAPLAAVLGEEMSSFYLDAHRERGVRFLGEAGVEAIEGAGRVERIRTSGGESIDVDLVVVGVGVEPRTGLGAAAGLDVDDGIRVDDALRASAPGVFAAGDVARADHPLLGRAIRVEHWANARAQGKAAARSMLGEEVSYDEVPYFFSDQYELGMEYGGLADSWDRLVIRGDVSEREFIAFWLEGDRVQAGMNVNVWDVNESIRELVRSRRPVDPARLADPDVPIDDLVAERH